MYGRNVVGYCHLHLPSRCRHPAPGQDYKHKIMVSSTFYQIKKKNFKLKCIVCSAFWKKKYIKSRTFNDKNRWIIKNVMFFKKLLPHLATRGTYSPGDWRCNEAWCEQTLVYPPVMCQQRLIYCTWELNIMRTQKKQHIWISPFTGTALGIYCEYCWQN